MPLPTRRATPASRLSPISDEGLSGVRRPRRRAAVAERRRFGRSDAAQPWNEERKSLI
jgi:hypothetical protein